MEQTEHRDIYNIVIAHHNNKRATTHTPYNEIAKHKESTYREGDDKHIIKRTTIPETLTNIPHKEQKSKLHSPAPAL
eukprot:7105134-Heterocapsa_arctica.AAC.1